MKKHLNFISYFVMLSTTLVFAGCGPKPCSSTVKEGVEKMGGGEFTIMQKTKAEFKALGDFCRKFVTDNKSEDGCEFKKDMTIDFSKVETRCKEFEDKGK